MNSTNFTPFTVTRYGVYLAIGVSLLSIFLGYQAGATFDYVLLRAVGLFVIITALGLGAEAVLTVESPPTPGATIEPVAATSTEETESAEEGSPE